MEEVPAGEEVLDQVDGRESCMEAVENLQQDS